MSIKVCFLKQDSLSSRRFFVINFLYYLTFSTCKIMNNCWGFIGDSIKFPETLRCSEIILNYTHITFTLEYSTSIAGTAATGTAFIGLVTILPVEYRKETHLDLFDMIVFFQFGYWTNPFNYSETRLCVMEGLCPRVLRDCMLYGKRMALSLRLTSTQQLYIYIVLF